ncbi:phage protease [Corynebacterium stationis]|uniref:phage protease n=1 Tax=Corynebacterium stationis TaxID=1705 RepID=UPI00076F80F1|nr:phage protease [Corynebacterium stationis]AMJ43680.1 hypothetical protein AW169_01210 [Corynebacterium stationis]AQX70127.1 hypothetical protein CA21670_00335 [Corynebacterium stationis]ASJ17831.1 hypothetical protein BA700_01210 [Corynebacterium stationis]HJG64025.1 hypothetical protein [Corynebacterium stationis]
MPDAPNRPILRDVPDVELLRVGDWPLSTGTCTFTTEDLAAAVHASQSPAVSRPVIKLGHTDPRFDGEPAVGFVDNLRLASDGSALVGDLRGVPGWLADIMPSAYPNRSIEGAFNYRDQTGTVHDFALTGLALLGVSPPAVGTLAQLRDVAALYEVNAGRDGPEEGIRTMPTSLVKASASVEDVRRHFYEQGPGSESWLWIEEMFLDPAEVIAMDDESGELQKISFSIGEDDAITWGTPEIVKREYVAASAREPDARWVSAAESRPVTTAEDNDTIEGKDVEFAEEQVTALTKALGLGEDADAAAVVAAVEKLAKEKTENETEAKSAGTAEEIAASAKAKGLRVIEAAAWDKTQAELQRLTKAANQRVIDDAVAAGKLMPASRESALKQMEQGLLTAEAIDELEPIVTMANAEVGHGSSQREMQAKSSDIRESELYKNWN